MKNAIVVGLCLLCACRGSSGDTEAEPTRTTRAEEQPTSRVQAPVAVAPEQVSPAEFIGKLGTYAEAWAQALPLMDDPPNNMSTGALLFSVWASAKLKWADVSVAQNETSFAKVAKDPDAERGKRLCASARIIEIRKLEHAAIPKTVYFGGMFMNGFDNVGRFIAVGSTGDLVQSSVSRFCGAVVGMQSYGNSVGGVTHAVAFVGMFDLPENR